VFIILYFHIDKRSLNGVAGSLDWY